MKRALRRGLAIGLGIVVGLLVLETGLRFVPGALPLEVVSQLPNKRWLVPVGSARFLTEYRKLWTDDALLRDRMRPNVDVIVHGNPEYPDWPIETSDLGLGGAGFRDQPPEEPPFAVVLGDSFSFGVGVRREETWVERLEHATGLPVVNLSQVGASSLQEARIYARYGTELRARVVLWQYFQNDLKENLRFARWLDPAADIPQASREGVPCSGFLHRLLKQLSLSYELPLAWLRACEYSAMTPKPVARVNGRSLTFCLDHDVCDEEVQATMLSDGWPLTRQAIQQTRALVEREGATLVVVIAPSKEQVHADAFRRAAGLSPTRDVDRLVEPLRRFCRESGLSCLDLTDSLRAAARAGDPLYFPVDIHWNAAGQALVAERVRAHLLREGLIPDARREPRAESAMDPR